MARQGYDLSLTRYANEGWRATFYTSGKEHSATSASGSAWQPTPWRAVQGAAWETLRKRDVVGMTAEEGGFRKVKGMMRRVSGRLLVMAMLVAVFLHAPAWGEAGESIFVADQTAGVVREYSLSGEDLGVFASGLASPSWITADKDGNIYVSEYTGGRVDKFSPSGALLFTIPTPYPPGGVRDWQ